MISTTVDDITAGPHHVHLRVDITTELTQLLTDVVHDAYCDVCDGDLTPGHLEALSDAQHELHANPGDYSGRYDAAVNTAVDVIVDRRQTATALLTTAEARTLAARLLAAATAVEARHTVTRAAAYAGSPA